MTDFSHLPNRSDSEGDALPPAPEAIEVELADSQPVTPEDVEVIPAGPAGDAETESLTTQQWVDQMRAIIDVHEAKAKETKQGLDEILQGLPEADIENAQRNQKEIERFLGNLKQLLSEIESGEDSPEVIERLKTKFSHALNNFQNMSELPRIGNGAANENPVPAGPDSDNRIEQEPEDLSKWISKQREVLEENKSRLNAVETQISDLVYGLPNSEDLTKNWRSLGEFLGEIEDILDQIENADREGRSQEEIEALKKTFSDKLTELNHIRINEPSVRGEVSHRTESSPEIATGDVKAWINQTREVLGQKKTQIQLHNRELREILRGVQTSDHDEGSLNHLTQKIDELGKSLDEIEVAVNEGKSEDEIIEMQNAFKQQLEEMKKLPVTGPEMKEEPKNSSGYELAAEKRNSPNGPTASFYLSDDNSVVLGYASGKVQIANFGGEDHNMKWTSLPTHSAPIISIKENQEHDLVVRSADGIEKTWRKPKEEVGGNEVS